MSSASRGRVGALATLVVVAAGCSVSCEGREISGTGNTNWLVLCDSDRECSGDQLCQCQLCGPSCDGTLECQEDGELPLCDGVRVTPGSGNPMTVSQ